MHLYRKAAGGAGDPDHPLTGALARRVAGFRRFENKANERAGYVGTTEADMGSIIVN
jgi:hypothetical protein